MTRSMADSMYDLNYSQVASIAITNLLFYAWMAKLYQ